MPTSFDLRDERGFTLMELLVTVTIMVVIVLATLQSFDAFSSDAKHQIRVTDANGQVRSTMDDAVNDLRGASLILKATATDLAYAVPTATGHRIQRLCVTSDDLYGSRTTTTVTPVAPTAACATATKLATLKSTTSTAFTYDGASSSASPGLVKNVGLTFSLDASGAGRTASSTLKASAARRAASALPVTDEDLDVVCNDAGALLSLSASIPGVTTPVTVTYSGTDGGIAVGTPVTGGVQIPKTLTHIVARITDAAGVTNIIRKDLECSGA